MASWNLYTYVTAGLAVTNVAGYRPLSWSVPLSLSQLTYVKTNINGFFFDAVLREDHSSALRITEHPVQSGANISDHAYFMPFRLVLDIGMSDVMGSFVPGQYGFFSSKSMAAYQTLLNIQKTRQPVTVVTRLNRYDNMMIENILAPVDSRTTFGVRMIVNLKQILTAFVGETSAPDSTSPHTTDTTQKGSVQSSAPTGSFLSGIQDLIRGGL